MKKYTESEIELLKLQAVQDYLYKRGANDEAINDKINQLKNQS